MVLALLSGQKTMTRRVVKGVPPEFRFDGYITEGPKGYAGRAVWSPKTNFKYDTSNGVKVRCPYGEIGDRLYVRENIYRIGPTPFSAYGADNEQTPGDTWFWKHNTLPSIHCPRGLSRIDLEITNIRVEHLNDISEGNAYAEGVISNDEYADRAGEENLFACPECQGYGVHPALGANLGMTEVDCTYCDTQKKRFRILWESLNGSGTWDANPWVWVVEFTRIIP
jgi:hypothetical protein